MKSNKQRRSEIVAKKPDSQRASKLRSNWRGGLLRGNEMHPKMVEVDAGLSWRLT